MKIIVAGTIKMNPEKADGAAEIFKSIMIETHKEPGNIDYTFSRDLSDSGTFHIYEKWESQDALDAHLATPHMETFMTAMGDFDVKDAKALKIEVSSEGSMF